MSRIKEYEFRFRLPDENAERIEVIYAKDGDEAWEKFLQKFSFALNIEVYESE